ncbi:MAG: cadherin-like beta sandwich domain-containing protein [Spirochaetales bacterium]|nr:cadherin-like beta sandwich domain-containing protein [Spirochaetales bacterium]
MDSGNDESIIPVENVNLSALEVSEGSLSPVFDQETVYYSLESEEPLSSITITPASVFEGTSITINDSPVASGETSAPISLDSGLNIIVIKTCSQSGNSSRIYVLAVYGPDIPDDNRNLWGVIITGGG